MNDQFVFVVIAGMMVQEHAENEKSYMWVASDYADGELKEEMFCIRFASIESESIWFDFVYYSVFTGLFITPCHWSNIVFVILRLY